MPSKFFRKQLGAAFYLAFIIIDNVQYIPSRAVATVKRPSSIQPNHCILILNFNKSQINDLALFLKRTLVKLSINALLGIYRVVNCFHLLVPNLFFLSLTHTASKVQIIWQNISYDSIQQERFLARRLTINRLGNLDFFGLFQFVKYVQASQDNRLLP